MSGSNVVFVDTETLGLDPDVHPIWEVALVEEGRQQCWRLPVTGRELALAQPKALEINRFAERYYGTVISPVDVFCGEFIARTRDKHLVGAVISFDEERLRRLCWKHGFHPAWHYHIVDVEALAAGKLGIAPPWDSDELTARLGVTVDESTKHTALGDALWAKAIYEAVLG